MLSMMRSLLVLSVVVTLLQARTTSDADFFRKLLQDIREVEEDRSQPDAEEPLYNSNGLVGMADGNVGRGDDNEDEENMEARKWQGWNKIAFMTHLSADRRRLGYGQHIKFDKVMLNDGNAYEPSTGIFTAPVRGVYQFMFVIAQFGTAEMKVNLMVDGVVQVGAVADGTVTNHDTQGVNFAFIYLEKKQHVWIETVDVGKVMGDTSLKRHTTFGGHLVYRR